MDALRIVLNEKTNDKIISLTNKNTELKQELENTKNDLLYVLNQFNIIPCECTNCKEKIYVSGENQSISGLIEVIHKFHWKDICLISNKDLLSFYGVCVTCSRQ
jgi:hypothetical protein